MASRDLEARSLVRFTHVCPCRHHDDGALGQSSTRIAQLVSASGVVMARRGQPTRLRHGTTTTKPKAAPTRSLLPTKPKAAQQRRSRPRGHRHKELELVLAGQSSASTCAQHRVQCAAARPPTPPQTFARSSGGRHVAPTSLHATHPVCTGTACPSPSRSAAPQGARRTARARNPRTA